MPESKKGIQKHPFEYFNTSTRPEPACYPTFFFNTRPEPAQCQKNLPVGPWGYLLKSCCVLLHLWFLAKKPQTCKSICISSNLHEVSFESGISWSKQRTFASINFIALRSSMREKMKVECYALDELLKANFGAGENLSWASSWHLNYDLDVVSFVVTHYGKVFSRCKTTNVELLPGPGEIWWQKFIS